MEIALDNIRRAEGIQEELLGVKEKLEQKVNLEHIPSTNIDPAVGHGSAEVLHVVHELPCVISRSGDPVLGFVVGIAEIL